MTDTPPRPQDGEDKVPSSFEQAGEESSSGLMSELFGMLMENKKYWMLPIVIILLGFGLLILLGGSSAAPFIYTLF